MRVLVTGATGFVGRALVHVMRSRGYEVIRAVRREEPDAVLVGSLCDKIDWRNALHGCEAVVHLAAKVHQGHDGSFRSQVEFHKMNVDGSLGLARQAASEGVRRFVFVSSIKVNGEGTRQGRVYTAEDVPAPEDVYGRSKAEAEARLKQLARETEMDVAIIRPPLVYGPGVKANFLSMMRWLLKGIPLPLGAIHNKRSFVALDNLVDLIVTCVVHPAAANQTFLVSDGEDLSTTELLRRISTALGKPARLLPVPVWMLETGAALLGKRDLSQRLCGSLQVDISKARDLLGWSPPISVDEGLRRVAAGFLEERDRKGKM